MTENLIVFSKCKEVTDARISSESKDKLNELVKSLIEKAQIRAEQNGRKTIFSHDF